MMIRRIARAALLGLLLQADVGAGMATTAKLSSAWPDLEGRWVRLPDSGGPRSASPVPYGVLDIAPCAEGFCGRVVSGAGLCGPTRLRLFHADEGKGLGTLNLGDESVLASVTRQGPARDDVLAIEASPPRPPGMRTAMPRWADLFHRTGSAACR